MPMGARKPSHYFNNSLYIRVLQCHKSLYLQKHSPDLKDEPDAQAQTPFSSCDHVRELDDIFPFAIFIPYVENDHGIQLQQTKNIIVPGKKVIYETIFEHDHIFVEIDILDKSNLK